MKILVTGASGLVGSEAVRYFSKRGDAITGIDNNMRRDFFGEDGDTRDVFECLRQDCPDYEHEFIDIRDRAAIFCLFERHSFNLIVHCAAQPSHDLAARRPFDDFEINALGTLNLLEATRRQCPYATFAFTSTNKVYGDAPNDLPLIEKPTRWEYRDPENWDGIDENCRIDTSMHSLFGVSKASADLMVQEYGRYFHMNTGCFRFGCITGPNHRGAPLHGFLSYLVRCAKRHDRYTIIGYKGKQVRDQIHAIDACRAIEAFHNHPRCGEVYNLGGGRDNSLSVVEAIDRVQQMLGVEIETKYAEQPRRGDHICYMTNLGKFRRDYPEWNISRSLEDIFEEMCMEHAEAPA